MFYCCRERKSDGLDYDVSNDGASDANKRFREKDPKGIDLFSR